MSLKRIFGRKQVRKNYRRWSDVHAINHHFHFQLVKNELCSAGYVQLQVDNPERTVSMNMPMYGLVKKFIYLAQHMFSRIFNEIFFLMEIKTVYTIADIADYFTKKNDWKLQNNKENFVETIP